MSLDLKIPPYLVDYDQPPKAYSPDVEADEAHEKGNIALLHGIVVKAALDMYAQYLRDETRYDEAISESFSKWYLHTYIPASESNEYDAVRGELFSDQDLIGEYASLFHLPRINSDDSPLLGEEWAPMLRRVVLLVNNDRRIKKYRLPRVKLYEECPDEKGNCPRAKIHFDL